MSGLKVGVACGNCGGNILMATCHDFRGTGHEWVLVSICMVCRAVNWTNEGCHSCRHAEGEHGRIVPIFDANLNLIPDDDEGENSQQRADA